MVQIWCIIWATQKSRFYIGNSQTRPVSLKLLFYVSFKTFQFRQQLHLSALMRKVPTGSCIWAFAPNCFLLLSSSLPHLLDVFTALINCILLELWAIRSFFTKWYFIMTTEKKIEKFSCNLNFKNSENTQLGLW